MEVIVQQWPQIKKCQCYMNMAHLFNFTVGGTLHRCHCWRTNQQSISMHYNGTIVIQLVIFLVTSVPVMCHLVLTFFSTNVGINSKWTIFELCPYCIQWMICAHNTLFLSMLTVSATRRVLATSLSHVSLCTASLAVLTCTRNCCVRVNVTVVLRR
jgi:hypothetical protein